MTAPDSTLVYRAGSDFSFLRRSVQVPSPAVLAALAEHPGGGGGRGDLLFTRLPGGSAGRIATFLGDCVRLRCFLQQCAQEAIADPAGQPPQDPILGFLYAYREELADLETDITFWTHVAPGWNPGLDERFVPGQMTDTSPAHGSLRADALVGVVERLESRRAIRREEPWPELRRQVARADEERIAAKRAEVQQRLADVQQRHRQGRATAAVLRKARREAEQFEEQAGSFKRNWDEIDWCTPYIVTGFAHWEMFWPDYLLSLDIYQALIRGEVLTLSDETA